MGNPRKRKYNRAMMLQKELHKEITEKSILSVVKPSIIPVAEQIVTEKSDEEKMFEKINATIRGIETDIQDADVKEIDSEIKEVMTRKNYKKKFKG